MGWEISGVRGAEGESEFVRGGFATKEDAAQWLADSLEPSTRPPSEFSTDCLLDECCTFALSSEGSATLCLDVLRNGELVVANIALDDDDCG